MKEEEIHRCKQAQVNDIISPFLLQSEKKGPKGNKTKQTNPSLCYLWCVRLSFYFCDQINNNKYQKIMSQQTKEKYKNMVQRNEHVQMHTYEYTENMYHLLIWAT